VSASVNVPLPPPLKLRPYGGIEMNVLLLLLLYKVQKFSSGTGSPGWSRKKRAVKWLWRGGGVVATTNQCCSLVFTNEKGLYYCQYNFQLGLTGLLLSS